MKADFTPDILPLGWQLQLAGRRLEQGARLPFTWLAAADAVRRRSAALAAMGAPRFERVEANADAPLPSDSPDGKDAPGGNLADIALQAGHAMSVLPAARSLPGEVRARLAEHVGAAAQHMRVHEGEAADALARAHGADALSIGADVYFAQGQYQPHDPHGFALLAHEAVHIAHALAPNVGWQRGSAAALAEEEGRAEALEQHLLRPAVGAAPAWMAPLGTGRSAPMPAWQDAAMSGTAGHDGAAGGRRAADGGPATAGAAARQPMAAAGARAEAPPAPSAAPLDLDALRQSLLRELKQQIRADMERGG